MQKLIIVFFFIKSSCKITSVENAMVNGYILSGYYVIAEIFLLISRKVTKHADGSDGACFAADVLLETTEKSTSENSHTNIYLLKIHII